MSGAQLGPYLVGAQIGSGGMGTVYEARDSRLDRKVAIKLLPPAFMGDPERILHVGGHGAGYAVKLMIN